MPLHIASRRKTRQRTAIAQLYRRLKSCSRPTHINDHQCHHSVHTPTIHTSSCLLPLCLHLLQHLLLDRMQLSSYDQRVQWWPKVNSQQLLHRARNYLHEARSTAWRLRAAAWHTARRCGLRHARSQHVHIMQVCMARVQGNRLPSAHRRPHGRAPHTSCPRHMHRPDNWPQPPRAVALLCSRS
jgi:hypothetical protein